MHDPHEGIDGDGMIRTGVSRHRVPVAYEPVVALLTAAVIDQDVDARASRASTCSMHLYGSVATGTAQVPSSDVDAVAVGLPAADVAALGRTLSARYAALCRAVAIGASHARDYAGESDEAYGNRVFLRHYCLHLAGPDLAAPWGPFPADARAARGFNGDIAAHQGRWRADVQAIASSRADAEQRAALVGGRLARKTLLTVAGLVSVHDRTWTTDREGAARRWGQVRPARAGDLQQLITWSSSQARPGREEVDRLLGEAGLVEEVVTCFGRDIGLWPERGP